MSSGPRRTLMTGPLPPAGLCPSCRQVAGGERCTHCGVAVRVGPYRVRQVLGQRGAARTYLADDTDGLVVLKELSFSSEPSAATLKAFHQEARQLQNLTHPRIPRYLDLLQLGLGADTRLYLVQEFIEGTPLEIELASRHSTELEARELARQVLDILRYLQGRSPQVFHGDIKPTNLIRRPDGALFLVDFGAGWVRGRASPEPSHYTPPEQTSGELDASTDLFALGVTLTEALSWEQESRLSKAGQGALISRVDVAPAFRELLSRLTSVDPARRFPSAHEALRELEAPEHPPVAPRHRLGRVAIGAGAAVLLFGAGFVTGRATGSSSGVTPAYSTATVPMPAPASKPSLPSPPDRVDRVGSDLAPPRVKEAWAQTHRPLDCEFARTGTAIASGFSDTGAPRGAFDHDPETAWRSSASSGAWLQVDLGRNHLLDALVLDWAWDTRFGQAAQSTVMTSVDGSHWSYLHSVINRPAENNVPRRVWFPQRVARYVRFTGIGWNGGRAHVRSLELYGPDCPLAETPTPNPGADQQSLEL
jgi:serine/threonine protein kinase